MSMFIKVIDRHDNNYHEVEKTLVDNYGYNEAYWFHNQDDSISVYYKDINVIQHLID